MKVLFEMTTRQDVWVDMPKEMEKIIQIREKDEEERTEEEWDILENYHIEDILIDIFKDRDIVDWSIEDWEDIKKEEEEE